MTASRYHSGSGSDGRRAGRGRTADGADGSSRHWLFITRVSRGRARQIPNGRPRGSRLMVLMLAVPDVTLRRASDRSRRRPASSPRPHSHSGTSTSAVWAANGSRLTATSTTLLRSTFALRNQSTRSFDGVVEGEAAMRLQCRVGAPDGVQPGDFVHDVAGRALRPDADFVLVARRVFLPPGQPARPRKTRTPAACPKGPTTSPPARRGSESRRVRSVAETPD